MRHVHAPFLGRVISQAQARLQGDRETDIARAVTDAQASLQRARAVHDDLAPAVLRVSESADRAVADVAACFGLVDSALRQVAEAAARPMPTPPEAPPPNTPRPISEPLLAGAVDALEGAISELWRALDVLASIQAGEATYSPFPTLNLGIKLAMNVFDRRVAPEALDPWLARLEAVVSSLDERLQRFEALHADGATSLTSAAASLVGDLAAGVGALRIGREQGDDTALLDGLRLLRHASESLAAVLEEMDRYVRETARWSTLPAVEDFCRAVTGDAPTPVLESCAASVGRLLDGLDAQRRAMRALPLAYTVTDDLDAFDAAAKAARARFDKICQGAMEAAGALPALQDDIARTRARRDECLARLEREMDGAALSPHLEELKELAGRFLQGAVSEHLLRERVIAWLKAHALLEMQVRGAAMGSDAGELLSLLHRQGAGIEEATRFFRDGDPSHLAQGFRQMEEPLAGLAEIRERVLRAFQPAPAVAAPVTCFKCATPNPPGRTHCKGCGALLPAIARAYAPLTEEEAATQPLPRNLARLQRVVDAYEQHQARPSDIQYEAGLFLGRLGHIRRDFERRFVPRLRAERSPALINMGRDFYENLVDLQNGLHDVLAFGDHGRPDGLYRGLQACIDAGRAMQSSQARIEEVLGSL